LPGERRLSQPPKRRSPPIPVPAPCAPCWRGPPPPVGEPGTPTPPRPPPPPAFLFSSGKSIPPRWGARRWPESTCPPPARSCVGGRTPRSTNHYQSSTGGPSPRTDCCDGPSGPPLHGTSIQQSPAYRARKYRGVSALFDTMNGPRPQVATPPASRSARRVLRTRKAPRLVVSPVNGLGRVAYERPDRRRIRSRRSRPGGRRGNRPRR